MTFAGEYTELVSVIIPNWNTEEYLGPCLEALRRQTLPPKEVIVVDNASTDGSVELLKTRYPEVKVIQMPRNLGFATAANAGIQEASGDLIALLNSDTEPDRLWLEELHKAITSHPEVGFCASKMLFMDGQTIDSAGMRFCEEGRCVVIGAGERDYGQHDQTTYVFTATGGAALYRRRMLEEIGRFDSSFFLLAEDVDLAFRAQLAGYKCLFVPTAVVLHHRGKARERLEDENFILFCSRSNNLCCLIKNLPSRILLKILPNILCHYVKEANTGLQKGRYWVILRAILAVYWCLPRLLLQRWTIQRRAKLSPKELEASFNGEGR